MSQEREQPERPAERVQEAVKQGANKVADVINKKL